MIRPTYTLPSIIKKVFRTGERSLPRDEIIARMEESGLAALHNLDSEALLVEVLRMEQSPVRVGRSDAILELTFQPHQLFDLAYRFLKDTHTPKTVEQIIPELRRQTQFAWNQIVRMLQLERDPRFVQYQGDSRWFLAEWKLANDQVYAFCREHNITQMTARSLPHFMEMEAGLTERECVFLPLLDERFRLDGETLYVLAESAEEATREEEQSSPEMDAINAHVEAAATSESLLEQPTDQIEQAESYEPLQFEEEPLMNTVQTQPALQEVNHLLRQALGRLEMRNQEMAQEVITHFQQSNMQAIEVLMKEKHKNEQIALGIQQVLAACEQQ
jgi:hypothetical protein